MSQEQARRAVSTMIIQEGRAAGVLPGILAAVHSRGRPAQPQRQIELLPD